MSTPAALVAHPVTPELVRGVVELEPTRLGLQPHRLPAWARARNADPQLAMVEAQPAGVRLAFRTAATRLELETVPTKRVYAGMPPRPDGTYDLVVDGELVAQGVVAGGRVMTIDLAGGGTSVEEGRPGRCVFAGLAPGPKEVEVWLPHDETTELVAVHADAPLTASPSARPTWVHHGSSLSQGSNAVHPTGTWPVVAARSAGLELVNLGFGGGALLDPFVGRVLAETPADLISVKVGINLVNTDLMRRRALGPALHGLLDAVRDGHPDTPLVVVTPLVCPVHEHTPGPAAPDPAALAEGRLAFVATGDPAEVAAGRLTLEVVREEVSQVVGRRQAEDPGLLLLSGLDLFGADDVAGDPLPDGLHLSPAAHRLVGERFASRLPSLVPGL